MKVKIIYGENTDKEAIDETYMYILKLYHEN